MERRGDPEAGSEAKTNRRCTRMKMMHGFTPMKGNDEDG